MDLKKELLPIGLVVLMLFLGAYYYSSLPEKIPTHWNADGEIDSYGGKGVIFAVPAVSLLMYLIFLALPKISVFKKNVGEFYGKHGLGFKTVMILFFFFIFASMLYSAQGNQLKMNYVMFPAIGVLFLYLGHVMPDVKRNLFIGIRTPWTIANDKVWEKTHKVGGMLFQLLGAIFFAGVFLEANAFWVIIIPVLAYVVFIFAYSYWLFRKENGKNELE